MADVVETIQSIRQHPAVRITWTILFVLVTASFLLYSFPSVAGADQGYVVLSGSMQPTIDAGDVILVEEVPAESIENGTVITFNRSGDAVPTTHRVVGVQEGNGSLSFVTRGDAVETNDTSPVPADQVVGTVMNVDVPGTGTTVYSIPLIGYVINLVGTRLGFVVFFAVPFVLLLGSEVWSFARSSEDDDADAGEASQADAPDDAGASDAPDQPIDEPSAEPDDDGTYTFSVTELRLSLFVLAAFFAYSAYVANELREVWTVMISAAILMTGLLIGVLYLFSDPVEEPEEGAPGSEASEGDWTDRTRGAPARPPAGDDRVVPGSVPPRDELGTTVEVESLDALYDIAGTDRRWIVDDGDTHAVFGPDVTYTHVEETDDDAGTADGGSGSDATVDGASGEDVAGATDDDPDAEPADAFMFEEPADATTAEPVDGADADGEERDAADDSTDAGTTVHGAPADQPSPESDAVNGAPVDQPSRERAADGAPADQPPEGPMGVRTDDD